jgi:hypothetical protein
MEISVFLGMIIILLMAALIQSAVGFAYALFSTPLFLWIEIPLPEAVTIIAMCSFFQACIGSSQLRASVPWRFAFSAIIIRTAATVVGIMLLKRLAIQNASEIKLVVGSILSVLVIILLVTRVQPVDRMHWMWGGLAFSSSGLLAGICGMGGPPLALWSVAQNWSVERTRGFMFTVYAVSIPIQIFLLYFAFGADILRGIQFAFMAAPAVYIGAKIGLPIGNRMPKKILIRMVYSILIVVGLNAMAPPLLQYLWN